MHKCETEIKFIKLRNDYENWNAFKTTLGLCLKQFQFQQLQIVSENYTYIPTG